MGAADDDAAKEERGTALEEASFSPMGAAKGDPKHEREDAAAMDYPP